MAGKVVVLTGPTATGKTELGIRLALALDGEIVSADSMQIYRRMEIGTAKPTAQERARAVHHMVDVVPPEEGYSAARYVEDASRCTDDILSRNRTPIIVGGTGLYIDALIRGLDFAAPGDGGLRQRLGAEYDELGGAAMLERLGKADPAAANKLHPNDKKRIVRALEVFLTTGVPISEHDERSRQAPPRYDAVKIALSFKVRADLYARIDARVDRMIAAGLEEEVRGLLSGGLPPDCTAMQAIGYKEMASALRGERSITQAVEDIKRESRRYAKRQLSWLRRDGGVKWILWDREPDFDRGLQISTEYLQ